MTSTSCECTFISLEPSSVENDKDSKDEKDTIQIKLVNAPVTLARGSTILDLKKKCLEKINSKRHSYNNELDNIKIIIPVCNKNLMTAPALADDLVIAENSVFDSIWVKHVWNKPCELVVDAPEFYPEPKKMKVPPNFTVASFIINVWAYILKHQGIDTIKDTSEVSIWHSGQKLDPTVNLYDEALTNSWSFIVIQTSSKPS